jgi:hypothetical protein
VLGCKPAAYRCYTGHFNIKVRPQRAIGVTKFRLTRIELPEWATQPDLSITAVTVAEYVAIQRHRDKLLRAVHREVEAYLNTPGLYGEGESFPDRLRMTGAYYIGSESYTAHRDPAWFQISVTCRCLERAKPGVDRDDDYLGLEVWLKCVPSRCRRSRCSATPTRRPFEKGRPN